MNFISMTEKWTWMEQGTEDRSEEAGGINKKYASKWIALKILPLSMW
jgi:hypothetical protein